MQFIQRNAVRIYAVLVAGLAILAHYAPGAPVALILAAVAAALGVPVDQATVALPDHQAAVADALATPVPREVSGTTATASEPTNG